ncbi:StAR-related lipid transfer protein 9 [Nymphon striatum]|nr:StAR-related lipid transfer protein 9 [Nymphon striatum]
MVKFKTVGVKCVADLLGEVMRASSIDLSLPVEEQMRNTGGWRYEGFSGKEVVTLMKTGSFSGMKTISYLSKGVIPASTEKVWKAVQNPLTRFTYDETVKKILVLRKLDHGQKLLHMYHESSSLLKKESQDFCILQTERIEGNKMVIALQSVEYENCPLMHGVLRGMVLPSGWIVETLPQDNTGVSCSITYVVQMIVNPSDSQLLNEVISMQSQCIGNLRTYLCPDLR